MNKTREIPITIRVTTIRDGTQGISLSRGNSIIGEWTDSGARSLMLSSEYSISICGRDGKHRYFVTLPGIALSAKQLSNTEATVIVNMQEEEWRPWRDSNPRPAA